MKRTPIKPGSLVLSVQSPETFAYILEVLDPTQIGQLPMIGYHWVRLLVPDFHIPPGLNEAEYRATYEQLAQAHMLADSYLIDHADVGLRLASDRYLAQVHQATLDAGAQVMQLEDDSRGDSGDLTETVDTDSYDDDNGKSPTNVPDTPVFQLIEVPTNTIQAQNSSDSVGFSGIPSESVVEASESVGIHGQRRPKRTSNGPKTPPKGTKRSDNEA
jgi:hypothetical protein